MLKIVWEFTIWKLVNKNDYMVRRIIEMLQSLYKRELIQLAQKIMLEKGNLDDAKAFEDIRVISTILEGKNNIFSPEAVDRRLRKEYPLIERLEYISRQCNIGKNTSGVNYDELTLRLYSDVRGIYADVLMKHNVIKDLKELIENYGK